MDAQAHEKERDLVLSVKDLVVAFGDNVVLDHLNLDIHRGEILGFVGGSGAGKSAEVAPAPFRHDPYPLGGL